MPKKLFQRLMVSPETIKQQKGLGILAERLSNPCLWHLNRRSVAGAFAIGLFVMWLPIPFQTVVAAFCAILWRVNMPISAALVFISNPITMLPMYYGAYLVAAKLMGIETIDFSGEMSSWQWWKDEFSTIGWPLTLGVSLMAVLCSLLGYWGIRLFWSWNVRYRAHKRKVRQIQPL